MAKTLGNFFKMSDQGSENAEIGSGASGFPDVNTVSEYITRIYAEQLASRCPDVGLQGYNPHFFTELAEFSAVAAVPLVKTLESIDQNWYQGTQSQTIQRSQLKSAV